MENQDESVEINPSLNWSYIRDHPNRILIIGSSRSGETKVLLNVTKHERQDIDKIFLYVKDPFESKYQLLINEIKKVVIKELKNAKAIKKCNAIKKQLKNAKRKVLIVFDGMIADIEANKKLSPAVNK